jgi:hypothetical protein
MRNIKYLILITLLTASSAFAVELKWDDYRAAMSKGYDASIAYVNSITELPQYFKGTVSQFKTAALINIKLSAYHMGLTEPQVSSLRAEAVSLFNENKDLLPATESLSIALRLQNYPIAASKIDACKAELNAGQLIKAALVCYNSGAISKSKCVEYLILASTKEISSSHMKDVTNAVLSIPRRGIDGEPLMTAEERKTFYSNFLAFVEVSEDSKQLLGICKTQYQLVK